jgi:4-oxalocrotonate tautomerase family enzyme
MPLVQITIVDGRSAAQKRALLERVTQATGDALGAAPETIRVILHEVSRDAWAVGGVPLSERDGPAAGAGAALHGAVAPEAVAGPTAAGDPPETDDPVIAVQQWFERFGAACHACDYGAGRRLCAPDVVGFGSRAGVVAGLDALQRDQWEQVWPRIADFAFDLARVRGAGAGDHAWGAAQWTSTGFDAAGAAFVRPGRASVALERRGGRWLAVHTHFSLVPGTPPGLRAV